MTDEELILLAPISLFDVFDRFKTDGDCMQYLEVLRWHKNRECPFCESSNPFKHIKGKPFHYRCAEKLCNQPFTVLTGTLLEKTKLPLRKWMVAFFMMSARKNGVNSIELATELEIPQKTSWYMIYRIRECCRMDYPMLRGTIEVDETYIGGKYRNKQLKSTSNIGKGRSLIDKALVFGMLERDERDKDDKKKIIREGNLRLTLAVDAKMETLTPIILKYVAQDSTIVTDEFKGYNEVIAYYNHEKVNHSKYIMKVDGGYHTNQIEGAWGQLKQMLNVLRGVNRKHLQRIIHQFEFMYNHRRRSAGERFQLLLINSLRKEHAAFTMKKLKADKDIYPNQRRMFQTAIQTAIREKQIIEITYLDRNNQQTVRRVEPMGIVSYRKQPNMIAWCHLARGYRSFRVERIEKLLPVKETFGKKDILLLKEYFQKFKPREQEKA